MIKRFDAMSFECGIQTEDGDYVKYTDHIKCIKQSLNGRKGIRKNIQRKLLFGSGKKIQD